MSLINVGFRLIELISFLKNINSLNPTLYLRRERSAIALNKIAANSVDPLPVLVIH
jgi:hypothetical protein